MIYYIMYLNSIMQLVIEQITLRNIIFATDTKCLVWHNKFTFPCINVLYNKMYLYSIMQLIEQISLHNIIFATGKPNCII